METLLYLGKVNLYWVLLYACYWLMLRNHTFFVWNRAYLIGSLALAFVLPLVVYPATAPVLPVAYAFNAGALTVTGVADDARPIFTWVNLSWAVYLLGVVAGMYQLVQHILQLRKFLKAGELIDLENCKVILIDSNQVGSFSFCKWIVINRNDYEHHFDAILRHEMVHTQQWHSLDILLTELLKVVFWFNPVLLLFKRSLQEIHEFLADYQAPNKDSYARFLVAYALNAPIASLTNHFFKPSQIKNRIQMIYKNRTSRWLLGTYALSLTLISVTALIIAGCERDEPEKPTQEKVQAVLEAPSKVFTVVEEQPEFPGGTEAMFRFIGDNIKYPDAASRANVEGRVYMAFVVSEEGEVSNIEVLKGLGFGCDAEAVRVLKKSPKWVPGKQNGRAVSVRYNLPINFQLKDRDAAIKAKAETAAPATVGISSVTGTPLYIVDGVISDDKDLLKKLSPDRIQSVSVLKSDAATNAYGEKGANGVVSIITKQQ